jgi:hypothetical protein
MLDGISGGDASGAGAGVVDARLKLLQAPRESVSAETIPKPAIIRPLRDLTMLSPELNPWSRPSRNQAQICVGSNDVRRLAPVLRSDFLWSILY